LKEGKIPIIDQSNKFIGGYWNNVKDKIEISKPVIIFGDHTKIIKYIDFDFVAGADGIKILQPNPNILPKYLYFIIKSLDIADLGYSRHFKELKEKKIPLPSLEVQSQIVEELDNYQKIIDGCRQVIENYKPSIDIDPSWEMIELGQLCSLMTGGTPKTDNKEFYENGDVPWLVSGDIHKVEIYNSKKFITKKGMESSSAKFLPVNSVLIALNGQGKTRGTVAVLRMKATCNQSIVSIKPNDEDILKTEFLYLYLNSIYKNIRNLTGDNQRSGLNMPIIREIKIPLAPIEEQIKFINIWNSEKNMINVNSKTIDDFQKKIQSKIEKIWSN
jgi:restriction endonuclease S subunit